MSIICFNAIRFSVEFIKLFLATVIFLKIRQHKSIYVSYIITLLIIMFASVFIDFSNLSIIYDITSILLLTVNAYDKRKVGIIMLLFIGISMIDMIFATMCSTVFHLTMNRIQDTPLLDIGLNCFSLCLILIISFVLYRSKEKERKVQIKRYLFVYLIGGVGLSLYLASVQFMAWGEKWSTFRNELVMGLSLSSLIFIVVCVLLILNSNENEHLKREAEVNAKLLETQKEYYTMLLQKEKETRAFRHDIKQHLYCIRNLYANKKEDELKQYLEEMQEQVEELSPRIQTGNDLITAITNDILRKFPKVPLQWNGMLPDDLQISSLDLCTIFSNLLSNALEAAQKEKEGNVNVNIKLMESTMMVSVINSCGREPCVKDGNFVSSKPENGHGYGIENIKKCVEKNGGSYSATWDSGIFVTEVIIPHAL